MNFAVIENGIVTNIIVCDSKEVAEQVTGQTCIEYTETNPAGIGWSYDGTGFAAPQPYPSWLMDSGTYLWNAPIPMPTDGMWNWNEDELSWEELVLPKPYPSWLMDSETYLWNAPIPMPTDGAMYSWNEDELSWEELVLPTE